MNAVPAFLTRDEGTLKCELVARLLPDQGFVAFALSGAPEVEALPLIVVRKDRARLVALEILRLVGEAP